MAACVPLRLLTFAPMVDSETARLICRWYDIDHMEDDHLFGWASLLTLFHGGYGRVPLLFGNGLRLSGPRAVVDHFDPLAPPGRRLLLNGPDAAGVEADWAAYNGAFAVDVAVFSYYHLLPARALMVPIFAAPVPPAEAQVTPRVYPVLRKFFATLLQLRPERAHEASRRIQAVFAAMDRRLGDGRRFLCGSRLTLGDIGFAGAVAPLLQPAGYGAQMPNVEAMPEAIRNTIGELRSYRAARYLDRIYSRVFENKASPHMY